MHILTNRQLRKAEQVEVQCTLANLYNDLGAHGTSIKKPRPRNPHFRLGYAAGLAYARWEIRKILDTYDDPDFLDGQED